MSKIKVGLVGYGYIGKVHTLAYMNMPVVSSIGVEPELSLLVRREESSWERNNWLKTNHDTLDLSKENVDIADICTPNYLHYSQVSQLIEKGINVYCEKPLGLNGDEGMKLTRLAEDKGIITQVALVYRFMPSIAKARAFILNGGLGEIINFRAHLLHGSYLNPARPMTWRLEKSKSGGGALVDLGIHIVDAIRFMLGEVAEVSGMANTVIKERMDRDKGDMARVDVDDWSLVNLIMESGAQGSIEVSKISINPEESFNVEIYGTKGFMKFNNSTIHEPRVYRFDDRDSSVKPAAVGAEDEYSRYLGKIYPSSRLTLGSMVDNHLASQVNVLNNVNEGKILYNETPTFLEATKSQKIVDAAYQSAGEGGKRILL